MKYHYDNQNIIKDIIGITFLLCWTFPVIQCTNFNLNESETYYISRNETIILDLDILYDSEDEEQYKVENVVSNKIYVLKKVENLFSLSLGTKTNNAILFQQSKNYLGEWSNHLYVLNGSNILLIYDNQQNSQFKLVKQIEFNQTNETKCFSLTEIQQGILIIDCQKNYSKIKENIFLVVKWYIQKAGPKQMQVHHEVKELIQNSSLKNQTRNYIRNVKQPENQQLYQIIRYNLFKNLIDQEEDMVMEVFQYNSSSDTLSLLYLIDKDYLKLDKFQIRHVHETFKYFFILDTQNNLFVINQENSQKPQIYTYKFQGAKSILKVKGNFNLQDRDLRLIITVVSIEYIYELDCTNLKKIHLVARYSTKLESNIEILKISVSQQFTFLATRKKQLLIEKNQHKYEYQTLIYRKDLGIITSRIGMDEFSFISFNEFNHRLLITNGLTIDLYQINLPLCIINATDVKRFSEKQISIIRTNKNNQKIQHIYQIVFLDNDYKRLIQNKPFKVSKIYSYSSISGNYINIINAYGNMARSYLTDPESPNFSFKVKINDILNFSFIHLFNQSFSIDELVNNKNNYKFLYINKGFSNSALRDKLFLAIQDTQYLQIIICDDSGKQNFLCLIDNVIKLFDEVHKMILLEDCFIFNTKGREQILQIYKLDKFLMFSTYKTIEQSGKCHDLDLFIGSQENLVICTDVNKSILVLKINQYLSDISTQTIKVIDNSTLENTNIFNPQSVSISSKFPSILFVKNQDTILLLEIGLGGHNKTKVITTFSNDLTKQDPNFKVSIKQRRMILFSNKFQSLEEYKILSPYEILKVRTFHNHQFNLIRINFEDSSSRSKFMSILGKKGENQSILIMKTDCASYHNLKDIIPLKENERLKEIQIIPYQEEHDLLILYTNDRLQFIRLYHNEILQYTYISKPRSNYLENFFLEIETKSQLYSETETTNQILYITLWNTHSKINLGKNQSIQIQLQPQSNLQIKIFKIVEDAIYYGQNAILNRKLICDIQLECEESPFFNQSKQKLFLIDKIRLEDEGFILLNSDNIQLFKVYQNVLIVITQKTINLVNSSNISHILKNNSLENFNFQNILVSYDDNITNHIAILRQNQEKFILELYSYIQQQQDIKFLSMIDITIFKPKQLIIIGNLILIFEKYNTNVKRQYSCIHILRTSINQRSIIRYQLLFDHLNMKNRYRGLINDFAILYNLQEQTYYLYIADSTMKVKVFEIKLIDQIQDIVIKFKYHINLYQSRLAQFISNDTEITKIQVENSQFIKRVNMVILTKNSNHIEIEIDQQSGQILYIVNTYIKYNDCLVSSQSEISSTLILIVCENQNNQDNQNYFYERKNKNILKKPNFCFVTAFISKIQKKRNIEPILGKILSPKENKFWMVTRSNSISQYSYSYDVFLRIEGQLSEINSTDIFIQYSNDYSIVEKKILLGQDQQLPKIQNLYQSKQGSFMFYLTIIGFITVIIVWVVLLTKYCMEENLK